MARRLIAATGAALSLGLAGVPAVAQGQVQTHALRWDPVLDLTLTATGGAAWIGSELLKGDLAPSHCRWCAVDSTDARVRDALVWNDTSLADTISNVTGFVLTPLAAFGLDALAAAHDRALGRVPEDTLVVAEAGVVAADLTQLTKMLAGRERPFVHVLTPQQNPRTFRDPDDNLSFFSGHSAEAFALAAASGTVSTMRGYRWAPLTWTIGGAVATATAYFRIAADKHWLTDVVLGAVVGAGTGFAVPFLFHSAVDDRSLGSTATALRVASRPAVTIMSLAW
jgi:membrane-associated phospholipid phosphatase